MSKTKIIRALNKQGASWEEGYNPSGAYVFEAYLPEGKVWDSGYNTGVVHQERMSDETMAEFWDSVWCIVGGDVIDEAVR